jgi:hypothetical protein
MLDIGVVANNPRCLLRAESVCFSGDASACLLFNTDDLTQHIYGLGAPTTYNAFMSTYLKRFVCCAC